MKNYGERKKMLSVRKKSDAWRCCGKGGTFVFTRKTNSARRPFTRIYQLNHRHVQKSPIEEFLYFRQED